MTMMQELATIDKVDLRAVWTDEASDFTPWAGREPIGTRRGLGIGSGTGVP